MKERCSEIRPLTEECKGFVTASHTTRVVPAFDREFAHTAVTAEELEVEVLATLATAQPDPRDVREPHSQYVGNHNVFISVPVLENHSLQERGDIWRGVQSEFLPDTSSP